MGAERSPHTGKDGEKKFNKEREISSVGKLETIGKNFKKLSLGALEG